MSGVVREPCDPKRIIQPSDLIAVLLCQRQTFRIVPLEDSYPINRVQSIPTVMSGTKYQIVERLVPQPQISSPNDVTPLKRTATSDPVTAGQLTVWGQRPVVPAG